MRLDVFKDDMDCDGASNNFGHVNDAIGGKLTGSTICHDLTDMYSERAVLHIIVPFNYSNISAIKISCILDVMLLFLITDHRN